MRTRLSLLAATAAIAVVPSGAVSLARADNGPIATAACKSARIGGARKCIARGQFCARGHASDYRRYGLSCTKRDYNGRYHLR